MKSATKVRLEKLESRRSKSSIEDMTDQERYGRMAVLIEELGGREKLLTDFESRAAAEPDLLRVIPFLRDWKAIAT
jgi:hypothetical protein